MPEPDKNTVQNAQGPRSGGASRGSPPGRAATRPSDRTTPLLRAAARFGEVRKTASPLVVRLLLVPEDATPPEEILVFNHVPKTGGTTLGHLIVANHPEAEELNVAIPNSALPKLQRWHRKLVASMTPDEVRRVAVVRGHTAGFMINELNRPARRITMLREPVDRVMSWFFYRPEERPSSVRGLYASAAIEAVTTFGPTAGNQYNGQARTLLAGEVETSRLLLSHGPPPDADVWRRRLFDVADQYMVGLHQAYTASLERFAQELGWTTTTIERSEKVNPRRPRDLELDEETVQLIRSANWLDQELYERYAGSFAVSGETPGYRIKPAGGQAAKMEQLGERLEHAQAELRDLHARVKALEAAVERSGGSRVDGG